MKKILGNPLFLLDARKSKKPGHSILVELLIFLLVFLLIVLSENIPVFLAYMVWIFTMDLGQMGNGGSFYFDSSTMLEPEPITIFSLFVTLLGCGVAVLYCRYVEERKLKSMGFRKSNSFTEYLFGGAMGILMITMAVITVIVTGAYSIKPGTPKATTLILCLFGFIIQGLSEEIIFRGYLMTSMARRNNLVLSVIISSAVYALVHYMNSGINTIALLNLFLYGILAAVLYIKRGNIWVPAGLHAFWNFYQGNIFGISVSGSVSVSGTVFTARPDLKLPDYITGSFFGIEGSIYVTVIFLIFLVIALFLIPKKKDEQVPEEIPEADFCEVPIE